MIHFVQQGGKERQVDSNTCPNCGASIHRGVAYHHIEDSDFICVIDKKRTRLSGICEGRIEAALQRQSQMTSQVTSMLQTDSWADSKFTLFDREQLKKDESIVQLLMGTHCSPAIESECRQILSRAQQHGLY